MARSSRIMSVFLLVAGVAIALGSLFGKLDSPFVTPVIFIIAGLNNLVESFASRDSDAAGSRRLRISGGVFVVLAFILVLRHVL